MSTDISFADLLDRCSLAIEGATAQQNIWFLRFKSEVEFACHLSGIFPDQADEWQELISAAVGLVSEALASDAPVAAAVTRAEKILAPIGKAARQFTIHCIGHAHIDMNWRWNWPETVAMVNDTFTTVDRLMDEFPEFRFSQSQTSIYQILKDYLPWLHEKVQQRVKEGRWEITANHWVEGDKNLASGESLCRQLLLTKRFFKREYGVSYDDILIDWEPDTFGHAHTIPGILKQAGVTRYYFCRSGPGPHLFWWQGKDGSRVLAFDDLRKWYNNRVEPSFTRHLLDFYRETGLKDYLLVYGVGDHGGGPTRRDLRAAIQMNEWPIFPAMKFSTTADFFTAVESAHPDLPLINEEMNTIFEGCYTSQSGIKHANRKSENALVESEMIASIAKALVGTPYPTEAIQKAWQHTLFNQFHDILPGSGVHATYEYSQGLFQEILAQTTMVKTRSLREIAARIQTSGMGPRPTLPIPDRGDREGQGLGGGMGDIPDHGAVSRRGAGGVDADVFVVFNPSPFVRSEVVRTRIWNRSYQNDEIIITDDRGNSIPAQFVERAPYWWAEHEYMEVAFLARGIGGLGYRTFRASRSKDPALKTMSQPYPCQAQLGGVGNQGAEVTAFSYPGKVIGSLENEIYRIEVEQASGSIVSLFDKKVGIEWVPTGAHLGLLEYVLQESTGMSAWNLGQVIRRAPFLEGARLEIIHSGPYLSTVRAHHRYNDSNITLDISLTSGSPRIDFEMKVNWLERGSKELGMPTLQILFPVAVLNGIARFECPNGFVERPTNGNEVPAQRWVDLTGHRSDLNSPAGVTLVNDCKYGFSVKDNVISMSLLRSSHDPDPLPEMGEHTIRFAVWPHIGTWRASDSMRAGAAFNLPLNVIGETEHTGDLPQHLEMIRFISPNVEVAAVKKAEDSDAIILRLVELDGVDGEVQVQLNPMLLPDSTCAFETDILEQRCPDSKAHLDGNILKVFLPAFSTRSVALQDCNPRNPSFSE